MGFLPNFSIETWTLIAFLITLVAVYGYAPYGFFKKIGVLGPKPWPFIGTFLHYRKGIHNFDTECYQKYGKVWGLYDGRQPLLCIMDTTMIKTVLVKECYSVFTNRRDLGLNGPLRDAVSITEDEQWKRIRSILSPSFTSGRLKEMYSIMLQHSSNLINSLRKKVEADEVIEVKEVFGPYSMDVVTSTAFSVDIDSINHPSDPFVANIKKMVKFDFLNPMLVLVVLFPFLRPIIEGMNVSFFPRDVLEFFYSFLKKIKDERSRDETKNRVDFMQLMVNAHVSENHKEDPNSQKGLTDDEILAQAMIFIFAGYETSSIFVCLLYPIANRLDRIAKSSVEINGVTIPKGTSITVPVYVLQRDPTLWPEPEAFKPERFSKDNKDNIDPYAFLPFGAGPRNCIGMRFALLMMKLAMVEILQRFSFVPCKETDIPMVLGNDGFTTPKNPIKLKLEPRATVSPSS
uniref:Cytochrome P450 3A n=1 Tax=Mola mola TaxID=94237 RepID=A0A3Q3X5B8_MOLML